MPQLGESIAEATVIRLEYRARGFRENGSGNHRGGNQQGGDGRYDSVRRCRFGNQGGGRGFLFRGIAAGFSGGDRGGGYQGQVSIRLSPLRRKRIPSQIRRMTRKRISTSPLDGDSYEEDPSIIPSVKGLPVPTGVMGAHYISPRMRARMNDMGLREADISAIVGTGAGGRVTVEDLERFLDYLDEWPSVAASPMRMAVADAMRRSWTRPLATVGLPVLLDRALDHRRSQNPKPGLTLYLLRALALALAEQPMTAGYLIGEKVVHPRSFDIGVAVQVEDGVVVPTVRKVDQKSLSELVADYDDLVDRARRRRLTEEDSSGGIATVTNFGTFGLTTGTPIPLPNETLILGIGAGKKKPVWSDQVEAFLPATEAQLLLTFDHRVVDGGGAGVLLKRVAALLQQPESL